MNECQFYSLFNLNKIFFMAIKQSRLDPSIPLFKLFLFKNRANNDKDFFAALLSFYTSPPYFNLSRFRCVIFVSNKKHNTASPTVYFYILLHKKSCHSKKILSHS